MVLNFHIKWVSSGCTLLPLQTNVTSEPLTAVTVLLSECIFGKVLASVERNVAIQQSKTRMINVNVFSTSRRFSVHSLVL